MTPPDVYLVKPLQRPPNAILELPGSKSHANRALVCAGLARGTSIVRRMLFANDTQAMLDSLIGLGVDVKLLRDEATVVVDGASRNAGRSESSVPITIDVQQSGTTGRFLLPVLAALPGAFVLDGDDQLRARPFGPQLEALRQLGAQITGESLPLQISGRHLQGTEITVSGSLSSQFLSGLLLAAPIFASDTTIRLAEGGLVSQPYVTLTLSTMAEFGVEVGIEDMPSGLRYRVSAGGYQPGEIALEPDASAASYFFAAAAITGGRVRVNGLGTNTVQGDLEFVGVLEQMGAEVTRTANWTEVRGTGRLRGVDVDMADISDTAQTLAVVAALADGPTRIRGIGFIRRKETDRIAAPVAELNRLGVRAEADDDGMTIVPAPIPPGSSAGLDQPVSFTPGRVNTYDDHRMAMSFSLLGLRSPGIEIADPTCVAKTFPDFFTYLDRLR